MKENGKRVRTQYICTVKDVSWTKGYKGERFNLDVVVESGPVPAGTEATFLVMPDNVYPQKGLTIDQVKGAEYGKIAVALAAVYGHPADAYGMIDDAVFQQSISHAATATQAYRQTPLKGRKVVFEVVPHVNGKGEDTSFYNVLPHTADSKATSGSAPSNEVPTAAPLGAVAALPAAQPAAEAAPALPTAAPVETAEQKLARLGWTAHPSAPTEYAFKGSEVRKIAEILAEAA